MFVDDDLHPYRAKCCIEQLFSSCCRVRLPPMGRDQQGLSASSALLLANSGPDLANKCEQVLS